MVKVSQQLAPSHTPVFRFRIQRHRKVHSRCLGRGKQRKTGFKAKQTHRKTMVGYGSRALIYISSSWKKSFALIHPSIHPGFGLRPAGFSRGSADRLSSSGRRCTTGPCAPLRTLCGISWPRRGPSCPRKTARKRNEGGETEERGEGGEKVNKSPNRKDKRASPEGTVGARGRPTHRLQPVLLEPLFTNTDRAAPWFRHLNREAKNKKEKQNH